MFHFCFKCFGLNEYVNLVDATSRLTTNVYLIMGWDELKRATTSS